MEGSSEAERRPLCDKHSDTLPDTLSVFREVHVHQNMGQGKGNTLFTYSTSMVRKAIRY